MSRAAKPIRRVRTLSSVVSGKSKSTECHVHQFQVACLELERSRRLKERAAASERLASIERRLQDIEVEVNNHLKAMAEARAGQAPSPGVPLPEQGAPARDDAAAERRTRRTLRY